MAIEPGERERENLRRLLKMARYEDLGAPGDLTSAVLSGDAIATGRFVARQEMVLCGGALLETIGLAYDEHLRTVTLIEEGQFIRDGTELAVWDGPARAMMAAERVALNFVQRLSGVATITRKYVAAVEGTKAAILDTRKTTPGWRELEKYAVRTGGGKNHRMGLYDAVLVKDNHLAVLARSEGADALTALGRRLECIRPNLPAGALVELEVDTLEQLKVALTLPVDMILLDNMTPDELRTAVAMRDEARGDKRIELEASGGITLENVRHAAETGVDRISVGALTHSAPAADISLDIDIE